jgi:hypothetical protein
MRPAPRVGGVSDVVLPEPDEPRPTYEQAREELVDVVRRLETGAATLEESLALCTRARGSGSPPSTRRQVAVPITTLPARSPPSAN